EPHRPILVEEKFALTQHAQLKALQAAPPTDDRGVAEKGAGVGKLRALLSRWYFSGVISKPSAEEIAEADHHAEGHADHGVTEGSRPEVPSH
ncbi:MAG TPA: hypothetical protein PKA07_16975, partial [Micropruina sp.]|nr:hypothetical protein [Micropruina sp.]